MTSPAGMNLGTVYGSVIISTNVADAMSTAREQFQSGISSMGESLKSFGSDLSNIGSNFTIATAPLTLFGATGIKAASDFDSAMAEIEARTGLTGQALEDIRNFSLKMGADTAFSTQQAADAFLTLLASGQSAEEAMATLPSVLNAAAASGEDLGTSAGYVTNVLAAFGLEATDAEMVVNSLSQASSASKASIGSLGEGFANVAGTARQFGLDVEDTSAVLAVFSQNGIEGAEAGTQLKSMLLAMQTATKKENNPFNQLGVSMYDASGNMRDFNTIILELDTALDKLPVEQQNSLMQELAGSYGITGLNALRTADGLDNMKESMAGSATASDVAQRMMETFAMKVDSLFGTIQALQIVALTPLMNDVLVPLVDWLTKVINQITAWATANPELTKQIVMFLGIISAIGPVLIGVGTAISVMAGIIFSPIALLIAGVTALGAAFASNLFGIRDVLQPVFNGIAEAIGLFGDAIRLTVEDLQSGVNIFDAINYGFLEFTDNILRALGMPEQLSREINFMLGDIVRGVEKLFNAFIQVFNYARMGLGVFQNLRDYGMNVFDALNVVISTFGAGLLEALNVPDDVIFGIVNFFTGLVDMGERVYDAIVPMFTSIFDFIGNLFSGGGIGGLFDGLDFSGILEAIKPLYEVISWAMAFLNPISLVIKLAWTFRDELVSVFEGVASGITEFFNVLNGGGSLSDAFGSVFGGETLTGMQAFVAFITDTVVPTIVGFFQDIASFVGDVVLPALLNFANWFLNEGLPAIVDFVSNTVLPIIESLFNFIASAWDLIMPALVNIANWFLYEVMPAIADIVINSVMPAIEGFINTLLAIWDVVSPALLSLADWFLNTAMPAIMAFISDVVLPGIQVLIDTITRVWTDVSPFLIELFDWFVNTALPLVVSYIETVVVPIIQTWIDILVGIWNLVSPTLIQLYDWFVTTGLPAIMAFITDIVTPVIQGFIDIISSIWTLVSASLMSLFDWFTVTGLPIIQGVIEFIWHSVFEPWINFLGTIWTVVSTPFQMLFDWFVTTGLPVIQTAITNIKDNVFTPFINLLSGIWDAVKGGFEAFKNGVEQFLQPIIDLINGIKQSIQEVSGAVTGGVTGAVEGTAGIANGLSSGQFGLGDVAKATWDQFASMLPGRASGDPYIPEDAPYMLHEGERVLTAEENKNYSGGGGVTIGSVTVVANNEAEGKAAGEAFKRELEGWATFNG